MRYKVTRSKFNKDLYMVLKSTCWPFWYHSEYAPKETIAECLKDIAKDIEFNCYTFNKITVIK